jgi:Arc/MetJ family transcription regulator
MTRRSTHETFDTIAYAETQRRLRLHSSKEDKKLAVRSQIEDKDSYIENNNRETIRKTSRKIISARKTTKKSTAVKKASQNKYILIVFLIVFSKINT